MHECTNKLSMAPMYYPVNGKSMGGRDKYSPRTVLTVSTVLIIEVLIVLMDNVG